MTSFIDKWGDIKQQIKILEKQSEIYKKKAEKIMQRNNVNTIHGENYMIKKTQQTSTRIKKTDIPLHLWDRYASVNAYNVYYVKKT